MSVGSNYPRDSRAYDKQRISFARRYRLVDKHLPSYTKQLSAVLREALLPLLDQVHLHWCDRPVRDRLASMHHGA